MKTRRLSCIHTAVLAVLLVPAPLPAQGPVNLDVSVSGRVGPPLVPRVSDPAPGLFDLGSGQTFGTQLLTDPGLNSDSQPLLPFTQPTLDRWMQENASLVTGVQADGVGPFEGDGVLALSTADDVATQVRQRIDVSSLATDIDMGWVIASAVGQVNASVAGTIGGTRVIAYDVDQVAISASGELDMPDGDPGTWERSFASLVLPIGTRYVEYELQFTSATLPAGETGYGDAAELVLYLLYDGLLHAPLGNAQLSVDGATEFLLVSDIGSTGADGVAIVLDDASGWSGQFLPHGIAPFDGSPLPPDATMRWDLFGDPDGGASGQSVTTGWWVVTGANEMSWVVSTPDVTHYWVQVFDLDDNVFYQSTISDGDGDGIVRLFRTANSSDRRTVWEKEIPQTSTGLRCRFQFDGSLAGPLIIGSKPIPSTDVDPFEVRITPLDAAELSAITRIEITGANLPLLDNNGIPIMALRNELLGPYFADGFESGDTSGWSETVESNQRQAGR